MNPFQQAMLAAQKKIQDDYCTKNTPNDANAWPSCWEWCLDNPRLCPDAMKKYTCIQPFPNYSDARVKTMCMEYCMQNMGQCDTMMYNYCTGPNSKDDPLCACINSKTGKYNPLCVDADCIKGGYQNTSMKSALGNGCQIVDCTTQLNMQANDVKMAGVSINQNCGQNASTSAPGTPNSPVVTIGIVVLVIVIIAGVAGFLFFK